MNELCRRDVLFFGGVCMLEYEVRILDAQMSGRAQKRFSSFLAGLFEQAKEKADALFKASCTEYESDTDEKKRFYFRPYVFHFYAEPVWEDESTLSYKISAKILRKARTLTEKKDAFTISKKSGRFLPLRYFLKSQTGKKIKELEKRCGVALDRNCFFLLDGKPFIYDKEHKRSFELL